MSVYPPNKLLLCADTLKFKIFLGDLEFSYVLIGTF